MCVCVYTYIHHVCVCHMCADAHNSQKTVPDSLELELQPVVNVGAGNQIPDPLRGQQVLLTAGVTSPALPGGFLMQLMI